MADLTRDIGSVSAGRPTEQPLPRGAGGAANFIEALGGLAGTFVETRQRGQQRAAQAAAAARQQRQDFEEERERSVRNIATAEFYEVWTGAGEASEEHPARAEAAREAAQLSPMSQALQQGRATRETVEIRTAAAMRRLMGLYPDHAAAIAEEFRNAGLQAPLTREYDTANTVLNREQAAEQERTGNAIETAMRYGVDPDVVGRDAAVQIGLAYNRTERETEEAERQLRMAHTRQTMTREERAEQERVAGNNYSTAVMNSVGPHYANVVQTLDAILNNPNFDPAQAEQLGGRYAQLARNHFALLRSNLAARPEISAEQRANLNGWFDQQERTIMGFLEGPTSGLQTRVRTLRTIQTQLGIDTQRALPLWSRLNAAFGRNEITQQVAEAALSDPRIRTSLQRELQGFDPSNPEAPEGRVALENMIAILSGNTGFENLDPAVSRRNLRSYISVATGFAQRPDVASGRDQQSHAVAVRAGAVMMNAIVDATPQWEHNELYRAYANANNPNFTRMISTENDSDPGLSERALGVWYPGMQRLYEAARTRPVNDRYYRLQQGNDGRWRAVPTGARPPGPGGERGFGPGGPPPGYRATPPAPSQEIRQRLEILNGIPERMANLSGRGTDPQFPGAEQATHDERRLYYATSGARIPPALAQQRQQRSAQRESAAQQFERVGRSLESAQEQFQNFEWQEIEPTPVEDLGAAIEGAENTTGNPRSPNLAGDSTAMGNGQFIEGTWMDMVQRYAPDLMQGRSRAQVLELRGDPQISRRMTNAYARHNAGLLQAAGVPNGPTELSLAHFTGPGGGGPRSRGAGAIEVLRADRSLPVSQVLSPASIRANARLLRNGNMTVGELIEWAERRIRGGSGRRNAR